MAHGQISELMPAPSTVVFDLLHNYQLRLEWDTLLRAAYLEGDHRAAGKGVTSVCVGRRSLGGIALRTIYVTFERPTLAAVKMVNAAAFFETWAASIHHEDLSPRESLITYKFHFRAKPQLLRFMLEPMMKAIFVWETRKRLRALRAYLARNAQAETK
ncbi:MAG: SRPBCC family protein [Pyrinomonadaceae bacterium]